MSLKLMDFIVNTNKSIILYGAGFIGKYLDDIFKEEYNIEIAGFCDSSPDKIGKLYNGKIVFSQEQVVNNYNNSMVIISVYENEVNNQIENYLLEKQFQGRIFAFEQIWKDGLHNVDLQRDLCAEFHNKEMNSYFESAESKDSLEVFWDRQSEFYQMFQKLDLSNIVELACGRGRHVSQYMYKSGFITLVDILESNIEYCRKRFKENQNITYYKNSGSDMKQLPDSMYSALFTYDAMVHFESIDVYYYLQETSRILKTGGMALFHHSNNDSDFRATFTNSKSGGRSYMSSSLFAHFAYKSGLEIVEQRIINWEIPDWDAITLVKKL